MLIDIRISELYINTNNSLILVFITALFLIISLNPLLPKLTSNIIYNYNFLDSFLAFFSRKLFYVCASSWESNVISNYHIISIGNIMYTSSSILILITSLILLLAMVGAIIITINKKDSEE